MNEYVKELEERCEDLQNKVALYSNINDIIKLTVIKRLKSDHNGVLKIFVYEFKIVFHTLDVTNLTMLIARVEKAHGFWRLKIHAKEFNLFCHEEADIIKKSLEMIGVPMIDYELETVDHSPKKAIE